MCVVGWAAARGDNPPADPEAWWAENGDGQPLGYSALLEALAPTAAARRGLLAELFEPTEEDRREGRKVPGQFEPGTASPGGSFGGAAGDRPVMVG